MLTRALIVMLVVLNVGVAAWWMWRPAPLPSTDDTTAPSSIARLQLLRERKGAAAARPRPAATVATTLASTTPATSPATATVAAAERCYRFGPFADAAALAAARTALQPRVLRLREQAAAAERGRGWRVIVPPAADRAAANALAERIKQAGFQDFFVIGEGADANAIALGRFSGGDRAQQHAASLRTAGFAAQAQPIGGANSSNAGPTARWLLAAAAEGFDSAAARRASGAAQALSADCAALR
jgi:cell division septation protein DedD